VAALPRPATIGGNVLFPGEYRIMKRLLLGLAAVALVGAAIAWSGGKNANRPELDLKSEKRNPWTNLKLNNDPNDFQFAIISDRTGGHRPKVFARAVEQLNLLQPELVMSVGDLIEGYTKDKKEVTRQWREFQTFTARLQMPFFYVPGNHDITNKEMGEIWKDKFGRSYYEFVYRDVLFLCLNSEDPPGKGYSNISADQIAWMKKALEDNKSVKWTLVFLHKPIWIYPTANKMGWGEVEKLLKGRSYTVFAGHVHKYQKFVRQGMNYYMLATTGGGSKLRGLEYGEFDHLVWVTMKKDGPVIANLLMDGILREDLRSISGDDEEGVKDLYRRPTHPVTGQIYHDGQPLVGAYVVLQGTGKERNQPRADGFTEADGSVRFSSYAAFDGAPAGEYAVLVEMRKPFFNTDGSRGKDAFNGRYATPAKTPFKFTVKPADGNKLTLDITEKDGGEKKEDK
jgi:hypothetical protein